MIRRPPRWSGSRTPFLSRAAILPQVYAALIDSPEAWDADARKFKTPEDFVFSTPARVECLAAAAEEVVRSFELLGQRQYTPGSPAGWPDTAKSWDGSDALMHRVLWASRVAAKYRTGCATPWIWPRSSLGSCARPETFDRCPPRRLSRPGLALLLMSPEFQRR